MLSAVRLTFEPPQPQRRVTVAFRLILAVPHLLLVMVLGFVVFFAIVGAWFAALFTARVPDGLHRFIAHLLQYTTRVYGYIGLLSDRYPPFDLEGGGDYAVELVIDQPDRFNRAAVLFRAILQLWALLVVQLVVGGIYLILFFVWLVTLIAGRTPTSAHLAVAAALRYQLRTWAYIGLLTTEYPHGLFGDKADALSPSGPIVEDEPFQLPDTPRVTSLVLTTGAKVILVIAILLGIGANGLNAAVSFAGIGQTRELIALDDDFQDAYEEWTAEVRTCTLAGDPACARVADRELRFALQQMLDDILLVEVPESALDEAQDVLEELFLIESHLGQLSETGGGVDEQRLRFQIEDAKLRYDDAFAELLDAVTFSS